MSRPPFPRKLAIGPHYYDVRREPVTVNGKEANGSFDADGHLMLVAPGLNQSLERKTLLHELFHAAWHSAFPDPQPRHIASLEERVVTVLAPLILDGLRRNPTFTARLLEHDLPPAAT